ncbi:hypothetical protein KIPB_009507, partial [Kipferlia bialata]
ISLGQPVVAKKRLADAHTLLVGRDQTRTGKKNVRNTTWVTAMGLGVVGLMEGALKVVEQGHSDLTRAGVERDPYTELTLSDIGKWIKEEKSDLLTLRDWFGSGRTSDGVHRRLSKSVLYRYNMTLSWIISSRTVFLCDKSTFKVTDGSSLFVPTKAGEAAISTLRPPSATTPFLLKSALNIPKDTVTLDPTSQLSDQQRRTILLSSLVAHIPQGEASTVGSDGGVPQTTVLVTYDMILRTVRHDRTGVVPLPEVDAMMHAVEECRLRLLDLGFYPGDTGVCRLPRGSAERLAAAMRVLDVSAGRTSLSTVALPPSTLGENCLTGCIECHRPPPVSVAQPALPLPDTPYRESNLPLLSQSVRIGAEREREREEVSSLGTNPASPVSLSERESSISLPPPPPPPATRAASVSAANGSDTVLYGSEYHKGWEDGYEHGLVKGRDESDAYHSVTERENRENNLLGCAQELQQALDATTAANKRLVEENAALAARVLSLEQSIGHHQARAQRAVAMFQDDNTAQVELIERLQNQLSESLTWRLSRESQGAQKAPTECTVCGKEYGCPRCRKAKAKAKIVNEDTAPVPHFFDSVPTDTHQHGVLMHSHGDVCHGDVEMRISVGESCERPVSLNLPGLEGDTDTDATIAPPRPLSLAVPFATSEEDVSPCAPKGPTAFDIPRERALLPSGGYGARYEDAIHGLGHGKGSDMVRGSGKGFLFRLAQIEDKGPSPFQARERYEAIQSTPLGYGYTLNRLEMDLGGAQSEPPNRRGRSAIGDVSMHRDQRSHHRLRQGRGTGSRGIGASTQVPRLVHTRQEAGPKRDSTKTPQPEIGRDPKRRRH